ASIRFNDIFGTRDSSCPAGAPPRSCASSSGAISTGSEARRSSEGSARCRPSRGWGPAGRGVPMDVKEVRAAGRPGAGARRPRRADAHPQSHAEADVRKVALVGAGVSKFGVRKASYRDLIWEAGKACFDSVPAVKPREIEGLVVGSVMPERTAFQSHIASMAAEALGIRPSA